MSASKALLIIIGFYLAAVIAADLVGVLANTIFDVFAGRGKSKMLYYAVWIVLAIFAGMFFFSMSFDYAKQNLFIKNNSWVIPVVAVCITIIAILVFNATKQMQDSDTYYVPGNPYMTYTFFVSFIAASFLAQNLETGKTITPKK